MLPLDPSPTPSLIPGLALLVSLISLAVSAMTFTFNRRAKGAEFRAQLMTKLVETSLLIDEADELVTEGRELARSLRDFDAYDKFDPHRMQEAKKLMKEIYDDCDRKSRGAFAVRVHEGLFHAVTRLHGRVKSMREGLEADTIELRKQSAAESSK